VAASLRRAGRKVNARGYDAVIAATALADGLPVHTCNPNDVAEIDGLDVVRVTPSDVVARDEPGDGSPTDSADL